MWDIIIVANLFFENTCKGLNGVIYNFSNNVPRICIYWGNDYNVLGFYYKVDLINETVGIFGSREKALNHYVNHFNVAINPK